MTMWKVTPKHWYSWEFAVTDDLEQEVGEVRVSSWRNRGVVVAGGVEHKVSRDGLFGARSCCEGPTHRLRGPRGEARIKSRS
ncbi:MAG: hypothetical protein ABFD77_01110 [Thermotogota bacterium]